MNPRQLVLLWKPEGVRIVNHGTGKNLDAGLISYSRAQAFARAKNLVFVNASLPKTSLSSLRGDERTC